MLKSLYDNSCASVKTDLGVYRNISIKKGVKQGDTTSAILFCIVLSSVIMKTEEQSPDSGYSVGGQILSNLAYADDIALANRDIHDLQNFVNVLATNAKDIGLKIYISKENRMHDYSKNSTSIKHPNIRQAHKTGVRICLSWL